jgi:hypothetical protein
MINANYVDGLELRIIELIAERNTALDQNTKLAAQITLIKHWHEDCGKWPDTTAEMEKLERLLATTPAACLAQVKAEAGRAGYYNGFKDALVIDPPLPPATGTYATVDVFQYRVEQASRYAAGEYAERIRQEVV